MHENEQINQAACATCKQPLHGKFCSHCGEKVLNKKDKSIFHFFGELFHMLTHADGKFLKSFKYLFTKPGHLTREYLDGRRKPYTAPLSLFFIANVIYFLFPAVDTLNSHFDSQVGGQVYSRSIAPQVAAKMEKRKWTESEMAYHYNAESAHISKMLLILVVFLFSIPVSIIFFSPKNYYFDHLIFATEFINFIIYGLLLIGPTLLFATMVLLTGVFGHNIDLNINSTPVTVTIMAIMWAFLLVAARRVYRRSWFYTISATLLITLSMVFVIVAYRYLLFQVTMLSL